MKFTSAIQPGYIIAITIGIAIVMFVSAFVELQESKSELFHMLQEHSVSLSETVERSSANIVLSSEYIEQQLSERLINNAYYIARMDSANLLTQKELIDISRNNNIFRINIFDKRGKRILSSHPPLGFGFGGGERFMSSSYLDPLLRGDTDIVVIGFRRARISEEQRYVVAIRRTNRQGGAIVLNLDAKQVTEFRKSIGIGRLISDLGNNSEIEYVVLQDNEGIILATGSAGEMPGIEHDSALSAAMKYDSVITRLSTVGGKEVFEVIRSMTINSAVVGVLRIGLSLDEIQSVEERMQRRLLTMTLVFIAIGVVVLTAIMANQNYKILSKKFRRVQAFTENILYKMQDIVITFDEHERVTLFNQRAEEFFSVPSMDVVGKSLRELPEWTKQTLQQLLLMNNDNPECLIKDSRGNGLVLSVTISTTQKNEGTIESKTLLLKDRTESKRLEREVQRKEKLTAMGELASGVAHEIRNPLNAISMIAQRYEKEFTPTNDVREYNDLTQVLKKEASRVNGIIQQFLQFARPPRVHKERLPAREFASHVATLISPIAGTRQIDLRTDVEDLTLFIDPGQMTQSLLNLLQNAIDATSQNGTISLSIRRREPWIELSVEDTGMGISDEQKEKIFDLYYTTKPQGTGIGLAVTQQIVAQHGGTIEIKSEVGKGSIFILRLPDN